MSGTKEYVNVMTDMTGQFNKVIIVWQYENLAAYEKNWEYYHEHPEELKKMEEIMKGYTEMYMTGSREIFKVW